MNYYVEQANRLLVRIKLSVPVLPKVERRAAEYILNNISRIGDLKLTEFAAESQCSQASIIRLCQRLNTDGFAQLKSTLKYYINDGEIRANDIPHGINENDSIKDILNKVFEGNIQTLNDTLALVTDEYDKALAALMKARHISFFAIGDAMVPCLFAQNKFLKLGVSCSVSNDPDMQLINASILKPEDVAVAISYRALKDRCGGNEIV